ERVLRTYLGDPPESVAPISIVPVLGARHALPGPGSAGQPAAEPAARGGGRFGRYPMLSEVVDLVPGEELVARGALDPAEDVYLRDHTLGRHVSDADPDLTALAVLPLTMSLEILAEGAAALFPGRLVIQIRDVRAHRWIDFAGGPQLLEVTVRRR